MIKAIALDDEPPALKVLSRYISEISGLEIVGQCHNAIEALEVLSQQRVDVIFLDIKMPRIIGTAFFKSLAHPPKVIFVTAYREYAVDGFELNAIDYLVKPVSFERFLKAITKLNNVTGNQLPASHDTPPTGTDAFVYLKVDKDMKKIFVNEIIYIESWKDYVKVFLLVNKYHLVKQSVSSMESLFSDYKFLRVHRSYIVSLAYI